MTQTSDSRWFRCRDRAGETAPRSVVDAAHRDGADRLTSCFTMMRS
jgi:hypothetical protein